jgi:hypothetical protein
LLFRAISTKKKLPHGNQYLKAYSEITISISKTAPTGKYSDDIGDRLEAALDL